MTRGRKEFSKCTVEGCESKHFSRGFCNKHYRRERNYGSLYKDAVKCKIDDCNRPMCGLGLCQLHYERFRRIGSITKLRRKHRNSPKNPNPTFGRKLSSTEELIRVEALREAGINPDLV